MRYLRTNTATRVTVGPFFDKTDGVTPETAITVTSCKLTLMVDTAGVPTLVLDTAPTASGGNNDMVHVTGDDAGFYDLELAAADVNYLGRAMLAITDAATHCPVFHEFMILPAMIYDSLVLGTDRLDTNVTHVNDVATTSVTNIYAHIGTSAASTAQTGDSFARIGANGASLSAIPWNAAWDAEVQSEVQDAIEVNQLDHFIQVADPGSIVANDSLLAKLVSKSATAAFSSYVNTTDSLEALRDRGDAAWITATGFSTLDAAGVRTAVGLASANLDTQLDALPTGAENATAVWGKTLETGFDATRIFRIIAAATAGKVTGEPGSPVFRDLQDANDMITGTADANGNRSAATYGS